MNSNDIFYIGIELCVALAAFSGIVVTSQYRNRIQISRGQLVGLSVIVIESFGGALLCALPIVLSVALVEEQTIWMVCSLLFAVTAIIWVLTALALMRGVKTKRKSKFVFTFFYSTFLVLAMINILNAFDLVFHRLPGPYIIGIVLRMCIISNLFVRLLVHPLWKMIHQKENEQSDQAVATSS